MKVNNLPDHNHREHNNFGTKTDACRNSEEINCARNVMDGNLNSVWACAKYAPCHLQFEFPEERSVAAVQILTFEGKLTSATLQTSEAPPVYFGSVMVKAQIWTDVASLEIPTTGDVHSGWFSPSSFTEIEIPKTVSKYWRLSDIRGKLGSQRRPALKEIKFLEEATDKLVSWNEREITTDKWDSPGTTDIFLKNTDLLFVARTGEEGFCGSADGLDKRFDPYGGELGQRN